jgi:hypothetical protein
VNSRPAWATQRDAVSKKERERKGEGRNEGREAGREGGREEGRKEEERKKEMSGSGEQIWEAACVIKACRCGTQKTQVGPTILNPEFFLRSHI